MKLGISLWGSRLLEVRGRVSGQPRQTPVNILSFQGADYLVAPRGQVQWVKNLRHAGRCHLTLGRRRSEYSAVELTSDEAIPVLREYLRRWRWEVGHLIGEVGTSDADLRELARTVPSFRLTAQ